MSICIRIIAFLFITGTCTSAICGGVNILLDPMVFTALSKARMVSPTGQCHTFSADADGYARGEGCGIVILKCLKDVGYYHTHYTRSNFNFNKIIGITDAHSNKTCFTYSSYCI